MISEKQLEANRRNARRSTGPKTDQGKTRSRRNNLRHGLTGQISLLPTEDRAAHDAFCDELSDSLNPETPMERQFALSIAEDSWRLNRARAIENNMFALGHQGEHREIQVALADARTFQAQANQFQLLTIYEQPINRTLQRNLKQLQELQADRRLAARARPRRSPAPRPAEPSQWFTLRPGQRWVRLFECRNQLRNRPRQPPARGQIEERHRPHDS
jgi:hypothetical protein